MLPCCHLLPAAPSLAGNGFPIGGLVTSPGLAAAFAARGMEYFNTYGALKNMLECYCMMPRRGLGGVYPATVVQCMVQSLRDSVCTNTTKSVGKLTAASSAPGSVTAGKRVLCSAVAAVLKPLLHAACCFRSMLQLRMYVLSTVLVVQ
jgi:hypothetical protein